MCPELFLSLSMRTHKDSGMKDSREQAELSLHHKKQNLSLVSLLESTELGNASLGSHAHCLGKMVSSSCCLLILVPLIPAFSAVSKTSSFYKAFKTPGKKSRRASDYCHTAETEVGLEPSASSVSEGNAKHPKYYRFAASSLCV